MDLIGSEHVQGYQVYNSLLPSVWCWKVQVLDSSYVVILDSVQSTFVSHVALSDHEGHGIQLKIDQIRSVLARGLRENMNEATFVLRSQGYAIKYSICVGGVVGF